MIDDDDVGVLGLVALFEEPAIAEMLAELADAVVGVRVERLPLVGLRHERQLAAIAGLRRGRPRPDRLHRARRRNEAICAHALVLLLAQVVIAAFDQRHAQLDVERPLEQRDVFLHELLLKRDRAGREHDLLPAANRRDQIGERFSDAGSGLDDRVHAFENAAFDQLRHLHLTGPRLEPGERARDRAAGRE